VEVEILMVQVNLVDAVMKIYEITTNQAASAAATI
jgi:hypothetical protein